jgi:hypothetical protein
MKRQGTNLISVSWKVSVDKTLHHSNQPGFPGNIIPTLSADGSGLEVIIHQEKRVMIRDRRFLFTEREYRAAQSGVKVATWNFQGPVSRKDEVEPGSGHGSERRSLGLE